MLNSPPTEFIPSALEQRGMDAYATGQPLNEAINEFYQVGTVIAQGSDAIGNVTMTDSVIEICKGYKRAENRAMADITPGFKKSNDLIRFEAGKDISLVLRVIDVESYHDIFKSVHTKDLSVLVAGCKVRVIMPYNVHDRYSSLRQKLTQLVQEHTTVTG